jgi:hypothetical protein
MVMTPLDLGLNLNLATGLSNAELTTLAGDALYSLSSTLSSLTNQSKLENFLDRSYTDLMLCQHLQPAKVVKVILT